ncbi:MAG: DUF2892 domain-containing protein [Thermoanaerobaculia bacterium]|nr:DUF2892 domain-containing protein [Thermoanaerobaculia bacterium]
METSTQTHGQTNVGSVERWLSVVAGSALAAYGIRRRSIAGFVVAGIGGALVHRGATGRCMVYESLGITTADEQDDSRISVPYGKGIRVEKSMTIDASAADLYTFWRDFENLPRFMKNLESVKVTGGNRSHWIAKGPLGSNAEWDAEIINEIPNELIGWRSLEGSDINNAGSVHFTPATGGRGTVVKVVLRYDPPGGVAGAAISRLLGEDPEYQVQEDLRRFKRIIETGELATIDGQSTGRN